MVRLSCQMPEGHRGSRIVVEKYYVELAEIGNQCKSIISEIENQKLKFDYVVAIARGGVPPAHLLASRLKLQVLQVYVSCYDGEVKRETPITDFKGIENLPQGTTILITDDLIDSGQSISLLKEYCNSRGLISKVAVLYQKPNATVAPDFTAPSTTKWIVFPWEPEYKEKPLPEKLV